MIKDPPLLTIRRDFPRPSATVMKAFAGVPTGYVVDAMGGRGGLDYRIKPLAPQNTPLLGIAMTLLGALLAARSWRSRLLTSTNKAPVNRAEQTRILLVIGLCLAFGVVLVGHGLPFWLAAAIFVTTAILALQYQARRSTGEPLTVRQVASTAAIGLGAGIAITIVFQEIFLVRLP
jgi:hypothetical protein